MSIQKRIFKSNTWIVFLSLFALLIIGGTVILIFEDTYIRTLADNAILQENSYNVQTVLNEYKFDQQTFSNSSFGKLGNTLDKYDYQLYVTDGSKKVYSNIQHDQVEIVEIMKSVITYAEKSSLYVWEDKTIITKDIKIGSVSYHLIAIHSAERKGIFKLNRGTFEILILSFLIVGIASILVILIISRFFTQMLVNNIMIPIRKLVDGAGRIEKGILEEPILYEGEDEFEMVCKSFNKMQESLKAGMEKNAAYEKARTDMVSGISHDLRTPLTSVKGYIKGLKDGVANTPEKQELYLDIAYKKACEMDVLLQKLFYFSKLETGNMPIYPVRIDFVKFMNEFIYENADYYKEKKLEISLSVQNDNHFVKIDKEQMSRVIANIIENSIKYKVHEWVNVAIEIAGNDDNEIIIITDNGIGIPEEKLPHLFEQFYRADEARNSKNKGSGLGLFIAKYIAEQHGGSIIAENRGGLSIKIMLPKDKE
ncbi:MAG TPA: HAMP domain-containing sensor histidine kinase [Mobilitalea sp.]|nr:HAMP domain-containing sensor histidine kinase [Mobilitalea sp.]